MFLILQVFSLIQCWVGTLAYYIRLFAAHIQITAKRNSLSVNRLRLCCYMKHQSHGIAKQAIRLYEVSADPI